MIDWTTVLASAIPTVPATLALLMGNHTRRLLGTPSGDPIGHVVERTHDLAAVNAASLTAQGQPPLSKSVERLNGDPEAPVTIERRHADEGGPNGEERRHE